MLDAVFGIFLNLLLFFIIGFWPTFWLSSSKNRLLTALAIAPTTGFAITSIVATYLVLMDYPVKDWSRSFVLVCSAISLVIFIYSIINNSFEYKELILKERDLLWLIAGFVILVIIVVLPMLLGGFQFTLFRGNAGDSFNYMAMAEYLDHMPLSWKDSALISNNLLKNQLSTFTPLKDLLATRWTTSAMLAFSSQAANIPINQFEYSYSVLFFIIAFGPAFVFARKLNLDNVKALTIALIICAGFWAQFVLDTRAFSQINSIPLMLAICCMIPFDMRHSRGRRFKEPILLGIVGASLIFSYPEIVPLCALGVFLFIFVLFIKKALSSEFILYVGNTLIILILLCLPNIHFILSFMVTQLKYAASASNSWHEFYYSWLYSEPIFGVWGLSPFLMLKGLIASQYFGVMVQSLLTLVGSVLSGIVLVSVVMVLISKRVDHISVLLVSFVCATIIQFLFLFVRQQWWAAGKSLALGYPFFLLVATGVGWRNQILSFHPTFIKVINGCVWVWVISQIVLFGARNINAGTRNEYLNYITHNAYYRQYDFDLSPLQKLLNQLAPSNIWIVIQDPAYIDYINLVFGWDHHVSNFSDAINQMEDSTEKTGEQHIPDFLILYKKQCELTGQQVVAENSEIALVKYNQSKITCFDVSNPNGIEVVNNNEFYWLGNQKTLIDIQSSFAGIISIVADFTMGPSLPEMTERTLLVTTVINGRSQSFNFIIRTGRNTIEFPVGKGNNKIELSVLNEPTVHSLPNGDPRVLLLGLQNIQVQFQNEPE